MASILSAYNVPSKLARKSAYLPFLMNGIESDVYADTGTRDNLLDASFAKSFGIDIEYDSECPSLQLPTFKRRLKPIGRAVVECQFPMEPETKTFQTFFVCNNLTKNVLLGKNLLDSTQTLTKFKNRLRYRVSAGGNIPRINYLGAEQDFLTCSVDGRLTSVVPDTGAKMNIISDRYALENGYFIDRYRRGKVQFADGSLQITMGKVWAGVKFRGGTRPGGLVEFKVLEGLEVDVILGEEILLGEDVFSQCANDFLSEAREYFSLCPIAWLGDAEQNFVHFRDKTKRLFKAGKTHGPVCRVTDDIRLEEQDERDLIESRQRSKRDAEIERLQGSEKATANAEEQRRREAYAQTRYTP